MGRGVGPSEAPSRVGGYRVVREIGRGGMGVVYLARCERTGASVALKTLHRAEEATVQGIRREIQALARLSSPGVVRIVGHGVDAGIPFYAMDVVEGESLRDHCRRLWDPGAGARAEDLRALLTTFRRLCWPLAYLHGEGIVHRDLKPGNVIVRPDGGPVIVDFGLSLRFSAKVGREVIDVTNTGGTGAYMAPEQLRGELVDARADLFALGSLLYVALSGCAPFPDVAALLDPDATPPPLSGRLPLPPALDALIGRLLAKRPDDRIGFAVDVAAALSDLGAEARDDGPPPRPYLYRSRFVGRRALADRLATHVRGCLGARGAMIVIGGESGIGKTRLAMEVLHGVDRGDLRVIVGECAPHGEESVASDPVRRILLALSDACRDGGRELTDAVLGPRGRVLAALEPELRDLPGQAAHPEPLELPPGEARLRFVAALAESLVALAGRGPTILAIDDLQWADDLTFELLRFFLDGGVLPRSRLVVTATLRKEDAADVERRFPLARAAVLWIERLDEEALEELISGMLAIRDPSPALVSSLRGKCEGNPFFVAEYLRTAIAEGLLVRSAAGPWRVALDAAEEMDLGLPRELGKLVARRLDRLSASARTVARVAAALGVETDVGLLAGCSALSPEEFLDAQTELLVRQVMEEPAPGRIRFLHGQIRDGAYAGGSDAELRAIHGTCGESLERLAEPERSVHLAAIGSHWERAGDDVRARAAYLAGARRAVTLFDASEAERLYKAFLSRGPGDSEATTALFELSERVLLHGGRHQDAADAAGRSLEYARACGDRRGEANAHRIIATALWRRGRIGEAAGPYDIALGLAREIGDRKLQATIICNRAALMTHTSSIDDAIAAYDEGLSIAREIGDLRTEGLVVGNLGTTYRDAGEGRSALRALGRAFALARKTGDRLLEGEWLMNMGAVLIDWGQSQHAERVFGRALAIAREVGNRQSEAIVLANMANVAMQRADAKGSEDLFRRALQRSREMGDRAFEGSLLGNLGLLLHEQGRTAEAEPLYREALVVLAPAGDRPSEGIVLGNLGRLLMERGDFEEARRCVEAAVARQRELGHQSLLAIALCHLSKLALLESGDVLAADAIACEAEELFGRVDQRDEVAPTLCLRGHVALAAGRDARELLGRARQLLRDLGISDRVHHEIGTLDRALEARARGEALTRGYASVDLDPRVVARIAGQHCS
ncbi:MAG: tetratricopeptide repeat protein [Acidobacteriota bacterium]